MFGLITVFSVSLLAIQTIFIPASIAASRTSQTEQISRANSENKATNFLSQQDQERHNKRIKMTTLGLIGVSLTWYLIKSKYSALNFHNNSSTFARANPRSLNRPSSC